MFLNEQKNWDPEVRYAWILEDEDIAVGQLEAYIKTLESASLSDVSVSGLWAVRDGKLVELPTVTKFCITDDNDYMHYDVYVEGNLVGSFSVDGRA